MTGLDIRKKLAEKSIRWTQRIAVRKAKRDIGKLYNKHQHLITVLMDSIQEYVDLEPERYSQQMITILCANAIAGFETQKEMNLTLEMITETIKAYNKNNKTPLE